MINAHGALRPSAEEFARAPFFDSLPVLSLRFLNTIVEKEEIKRAQFMKGLAKVLPSFPKRIIQMKVLPILFDECKGKGALMVPFVLPNILAIADTFNMNDYDSYIFSGLIPLLTITEPIQVLQVLYMCICVLLYAFFFMRFFCIFVLFYLFAFFL